MKKLFIDITGSLFIILFIYAAISKVIDFEKFTIDLGKSPLLTSFPTIVAITIPATELAISVSLIIPRCRLFGFYLATTLMMLFTFYIIAVLKFADYVPCSCGGILQHMSWNAHILFNLSFVLLGVLTILIYPEKMDPASA